MRFTTLLVLVSLSLVNIGSVLGVDSSWCATQGFVKAYVTNSLQNDYKIDQLNKLEPAKTREIGEKAVKRGYKLAIVAREDFTERANEAAKLEHDEIKTWMKLLAQESYVKDRKFDTFALILERKQKFWVYLYSVRGSFVGSDAHLRRVAKEVDSIDTALARILPGLSPTIVERGISMGLGAWGFTKFMVSVLVTNVVFVGTYLGIFKTFKWSQMGRPDQVRVIQGLRDVASLTISRSAGDAVMRAFT